MPDENDKHQNPPASAPHPGGAEPVSYSVDEHTDDYHSQHYGARHTETPAEVVLHTNPEPPPPPPPPPAPEKPGDDDDEEGMLRMSFLEHLEELRARILKALYGIAIYFFVCLTFSERLWAVIQAPAAEALKSLHLEPYLIFTSPMDAFLITWFKVPLLVSLFLASPWVLYQVWSFIAPGLYKNERKMAVPFVISTAGLFILGGLFGYFVAFRFGLAFLLGVGQNVNIRPMITVTEYFDIFVNVMLGIGVVFEMPVLIFMLTFLRITTPTFLLNHSRYAILIIVIIAAIITPTPDVFNLMLFSVPMVILFFIGIFASYLLVLNREGKSFPWARVIGVTLLILAVLTGLIYLAAPRLGYHFVGYWPYLTK